MKLSDLPQQAMADAIEQFYATVSDHVAHTVHAVSMARYSIPRERRRIGPHEFSYHLAADLDLLRRFAVGDAEASASHVEDLCTSVLDLLHTAPLGRVEVSWETLSSGPLGPIALVIRAARARLKLRDESHALSADEVALLSGLTPQKLSAEKIKRLKKGYPSSAVRTLFEKEGLPV